MKKLVAAALSLLLTLFLAGCAADSGQQQNNPSPALSQSEPEEPEQMSADGAELWAMLDGIWSCEQNHEGYFASFSNTDGRLCYSAGVLDGETLFEGYLDSASAEGDSQYRLKISLTLGEVNGSTAAELLLDYNDASGLTLSNLAADGSSRHFGYFGPKLPAAEQETAAQLGLEELWSSLEGIWVYNEEGALYFANFSTSDGSHDYSCGLLFSGFGMYGYVEDFDYAADSGLYRVGLFFPAVPENEMDSGSDEFRATLEIDCTARDIGHLTLTNLAADGEPQLFKFLAYRIDGLDYEEVAANY